ncbi:hypothetical protein [Rhizobium mongolense]|uniref:Uncharacterized protein n=2 Tax=Rhizobium mongolense TaxID=57676 RepID=A0ABR6IJD0_9HYPH|nr:hypothetical protein [Rhizobium mongolense]MBB4227967.1 hypothetical protein [Rhizobium mongolense]TVZ64879.1 hypothetical protein BCL32_5152 [Rhizobium mongolense USDA 1844]
MLRAIANVIARMFKAGAGALRWTENFVLSPFRAIFGGGGALPNPEFSPTMTSTDLLEEYEANRQAQAWLQRTDRDGTETVMKNAASSAAARATIDLSPVRSDARLTLLTMDDVELKALAAASPSKVRKWLEGKEHGIFGVPVVTTLSNKPVSAPVQPVVGMTPQARMIWRIQSRLGKPDHSKEFRIA